MTWIPGLSERECRSCGKWHVWRGTAPYCRCGAQIRNITMRPRQVTQKKLDDCRARVKPAPELEMTITRCANCHRWHVYTAFPGCRYWCGCGRRLGGDLSYTEIWDLLAEEERVSRLMAQHNDMEGSSWLS